MNLVVSTVLVFILGTIFGSFLNVVIYRVPQRLSIVRPASRCPHCQTPIRPYDNIPLVSFLILRGRCRSCHAPISWRYPLVEAATGVPLAGLWVRFAPSAEWVPFVAASVFVLMLIAVFFIDLDHQIVPNAITYPGLAIGLLLAIPQGRVVPSLLSALGAGVAFLLIAILSEAVMKREGMGGGDIKLAAMIGAFLSWPAVVVALMLAVTVGAIGGLLLMALRKRTRTDPIPFGPSLAVGGIIALFAADGIVRWYLHLFQLNVP
jgi:leader peptidase (prepilin peptidase) / N-methyltransferase